MGRTTSCIDKIMVGRRLETVRRQVGLTQDDFALATGVCKRAYIDYERGEQEQPAGLFKAIHDLYGIDYFWLISGTVPEPQRSGVEWINFIMVLEIISVMDQQVADRFPSVEPMDTALKAELLRTLYQFGVESGHVSPDVISGILDAALIPGELDTSERLEQATMNSQTLPS